MTAMTPKIVVTGFEPWQHGTENPTLNVLDQLEHSNAVPGELTTIRLPVDTTKLAAIVEEALDQVTPDVWISLGLATGHSVIAVERMAANVRDFPIPDNAGHQPGGDPVFAGGPAAYLSTLPVKAMTFALRAAGIPAKLSNSPSTYLCNQMMYTVLHLIERKRMPTKAGFIHVPATPSYVAKQAYPFVEMPSMSVELMTNAVLESLAAIAAATRDVQTPTFNY
jgi:pyroglutamyl-peptidase